jgi:hypothetical protein
MEDSEGADLLLYSCMSHLWVPPVMHGLAQGTKVGPRSLLSQHRSMVEVSQRQCACEIMIGSCVLTQLDPYF